MILRGVAHVHSRYSFDGHHSLEDIVDFLKGHGLDFVLMSEHTKRLTEAALRSFVADCAALSNDRFLVVPGLEHEATPDYVHILAYNVRALIQSRDAATIVRSIRDQGGFAVLAHPGWREAFRHVPAEALALLRGWEVWNGKADGRWLPGAGGVQRLSNVHQTHPHLVPLGGLDLHRLDAYPGITLRVESPARTGEGVIAALAAGAFTVIGERFRFSPREPLKTRALARMAARAVRGLKRYAESLDRQLAKQGLQAPEPLYRFARSLFR